MGIQRKQSGRMLTWLIALGVLAIASCGSDSKGSEATTAPSSASLEASDTVATVPAATGAATTEPAATAPAASDAGPTTDGSAATGAGSADPCRLLTADEAAAALGREVESRVIEAGQGLALCDYYDAKGDAGPASVHAAVLSDDIPKDLWEQAQIADGLQAVPGVGELAFFDGDTTLEVYANGTWISVQMINSMRFSEVLAIMSEIGRNAVDRL